MNTMKAIQFKFNDKHNPTILELPKPIPVEGEVLVKVVAAAMDTATDQVLSKRFAAKFIHSTSEPLILGWHFAGNVVQTGGGPGVSSSLQVGDAVWGHLQYDPNQEQGSYAEYITIAEDACALKPKSVSYQQAAAAATESMTALQALRDEAGLEKGMDVLIVGAGGGVGITAVSIAKRLGAARVTAVCSTKDVERVRAAGADQVVDRKKQDVLASNMLQRYNVIFDTPSAFSVSKSLSFLKAGGAYVVTLPSWSMLWGFMWSMFSSKKVRMVSAKSKKEDLELVNKWMEDGLDFEIDSTHKIKDIKAAVARQNDSRKVGRVVIDVEGGWP